ncbi:MAG: cobalt ECF transporter T component CbiQ [Candidatus Rokuibacteriota bacterium]
MSGGHAHGLYVHGHGRLHAMSPQCKLAAAFSFVVAVVSTPREALWAYAAYAVVVLALARSAGLPLPVLARRLFFEAPFVVAALLQPIVGEGPRTEVLGVSLSVEGLWAAWNIFAKATLSLVTAQVLAATTPAADLLHGLEHLRMPRHITAIAGFMIRYADIITGELQRMRVAREARAYDPRWLWQGHALAASAGTLFIRSYERGERVYQAMASRGYSGAMPILSQHSPSRSEWVQASTLPALAAVVSACAWMLS